MTVAQARLHRAYADYVESRPGTDPSVKTFEQFKYENEVRKGVVSNLRGFIEVRRMVYPYDWNTTDINKTLDEYERKRVI